MTTLNVEQAARLVLCTPRWIQDLVNQGYIPRSERGVYPLIGVVHGRIKSLEDAMKRQTQSSAQDELTRVKTREGELRIAEKEHRLIDIDEAFAVVEEIIGTFKSETAGLPARLTKDLSLRANIETELNGVLTRASTRFAERASALRASGEAIDADTEDES